VSNNIFDGLATKLYDIYVSTFTDYFSESP